MGGHNKNKKKKKISINLEVVIIDSFIGWVGGKKLLRKQICSLFPQNIKTYVEVFGGAGWVLFNEEKHARKEIFNDINSELINLFKCVKYHPDAIIKEMELYLNSRELFNLFHKHTVDGLTEIQRAARYLYLIKASYGNNVSSYGGKPRDLLALNNLKDIQKRLSKVIIENKSYENIITQYDSQDTLFYLDPPYYKAEKFYDTGDFVFNKEQHIKLAELLKSIKGKFILSYNDCEFIREIYIGFQVHEIQRQSNLASRYGKNKVYKELIINNY